MQITRLLGHLLPLVSLYIDKQICIMDTMDKYIKPVDKHLLSHLCIPTNAN